MPELTLLDAALSYHERGWCVIPLWPGTKVPRLERGEVTQFHSRCSTRDEIAAWWEREPNSNIGIVCGQVSKGLTVIDIDSYKVGPEPEVEFPLGPVVETGRGGRHIYLHSAQVVRSGYPQPKLEIKGEGTYVVAPPSVHPDTGKEYRWSPERGPEIELPEVPDGVIRRKEVPPASDAVVLRILERVEDEGGVEALFDGVDEGSRNNAAASISGWICRKTDNYDVGWRLLQLWNHRNPTPLGENELRRTFDSIRRTAAERGTLVEGGGESAWNPGEVPKGPFSIPISRMFARPEEPIPWLVENLVEAGTIGFIGGCPKQTKSWLALHIAHALATGNPVLGHFHVKEKRRVLYIQEEDGERLVRRRIGQMMEGHGFALPEDEFFHYSVRVGLQIDRPEWVEALKRDCEAFKPDLIIADVLNKMHSKEENSQPGMTVVMSGFERIRRATNAAILIVHHFGKRSEGRGNKNLRGSSVLSGCSENSLYVYEEVKDKLYSVDFESKTMAQDPFKYALEARDWEPGKPAIRLQFAGQDKANQVPDDLGKVLAAIRDQIVAVGPTGCTSRRLKEVVGLSDGTVRTHARRLVQAGLVRVDNIRVKGQRAEAFVPVEVAVSVDEQAVPEVSKVLDEPL